MFIETYFLVKKEQKSYIYIYIYFVSDRFSCKNRAVLCRLIYFLGWDTNTIIQIQHQRNTSPYSYRSTLRSWILLLHIDARFSGHSFFFIPRTITTTTTSATTITTSSYVSVPTIPNTTTTTLMVTPIYTPLIFHLFLETQKLQILFLCQTIPIWRLLLLAANNLMPLPICKFCSNPLLLLSI